MAKTRVSKVVVNYSQEDFNKAFAEYAMSAGEISKQTAKMEQEITKVREKYSDVIANHQEAAKASCTIIEDYCKENKDALFTDKRSMDTLHGTVGFRKGTPKLKMLPKWNWDKVLDKVKELLPEYVRKKEEVDKDALIDARKDEKVAPFMNQVGVYVVQDEIFFVQLKSEEVEVIPE